MQQISKPAPEKEHSAETCRHYWVIEESVGAMSIGVCQECSEVREFNNYVEATPWAEDSPSPKADDELPLEDSLRDLKFVKKLQTIDQEEILPAV